MDDLNPEEIEKVFRTSAVELATSGVYSPDEYRVLQDVISEFLKNEVHN